MRRLLYVLLFSTSVALLSGCARTRTMPHKPIPPAPKSTPTPTPKKKLPYFDRIQSSGGLNIYIVGHSGASTVKISQKKGDPRRVNYRVARHTLYLSTVHQENTKRSTLIRVNLRMQNLKNLHVTGNTAVHTQGLKSKGLTIQDSSSGILYLRGDLSIRSILASQRARIDVQWLDNHQPLQVTGIDYSNVRLAGVAQLMHINLSGHAKLEAKYLRAEQGWVKTQDAAVAKVMVIGSLRAFANDRSNIYYYKTPRDLTRNTTGSGNVLQVDWRN